MKCCRSLSVLSCEKAFFSTSDRIIPAGPFAQFLRSVAKPANNRRQSNIAFMAETLQSMVRCEMLVCLCPDSSFWFSGVTPLAHQFGNDVPLRWKPKGGPELSGHAP